LRKHIPDVDDVGGQRKLLVNARTELESKIEIERMPECISEKEHSLQISAK